MHDLSGFCITYSNTWFLFYNTVYHSLRTGAVVIFSCKCFRVHSVFFVSFSRFDIYEVYMYFF